MPARDCKYVARVKANVSDFAGLYEAANKFANGSDRYVEIQPGHVSFHFAAHLAYLKFRIYVVRQDLQFVASNDQHISDLGKPPVEAKKATSENFRACRKLVHDDAFEAQLALHMVEPLLKNALQEMKIDYLYDSGLFLRRALVRYLTLALYRLLDKPNASGRTGITASISSLLEMAKSEGVLSETQFQTHTIDFGKIKTDGADGEYDLVQAISDLRNIQVAHSLIPWEDPTEQLWAHHLLDFAGAVFDFVVNLEATLAEATGVTLLNLHENSESFEASAGQFWRALTLMKK